MNYFAILVASLSTFILGGLWYSPLLFGKAWQSETGLTKEELDKGNPMKTFGGAFVFSLIMAAVLAKFLDSPETDLLWGLEAGVLAGGGWVAAAIAIIGLFELRSWRYILINGGYMIVAFTCMGAIIGAWR